MQTQAPETLFYQLKKVPKLSKLLSDGEEEFLPVREDEQEFLESLITVEEKDGKEVYLVKRSEIQVDEEGNIVWTGTPLSRYIGNVVRKRIRKRYVVIEKELFGKKRNRSSECSAKRGRIRDLQKAISDLLYIEETQ
mgnify:CR=1 FL=1